jgi:hypothetical protein
MVNYLRIQPITLSGIIDDETVNAIFWSCQNLVRGGDKAKLLCEMVNISNQDYIDENGDSQIREFISNTLFHFEMEIPKNILESWLDDSVIDNFVLTYSPKFIKDTNQS